MTPLGARVASAVASAVAATPLPWDRGDGVTLSCADVTLPGEAADPARALQIAAHRLAIREQRQRTSVRGQLRDVLLAVMTAHRPELRRHGPDIAYLILAVGRELGLEREQIDDAILAAELREIGLLAVTDAPSARHGARDPGAPEEIREHPVAGAQILRAARALVPVATLVRAVNERVDGGGYPDGLRGDAIPLGARLIAVCAEFVTLTAGAPPPALDTAEALTELTRRASTQFDPVIVDALASVTREAGAAPEEPRGAAGFEAATSRA
jgi:two-component system, cell cycle response regulator